MRHQLNMVLARGDSVQVFNDSYCVEVNVADQRRELVDIYIRKHFKVTSTYQSTASSTGQVYRDSSDEGMCRIKVIKSSLSNMKNTDLRLGKKSGAKISEFNQMGKSESILLLSSGKSGQLSLDDKEIIVTCYKKRDKFDLEFKAKEANNSLATSVTVNAGESVDLGGIADKIDNKNRDINVLDHAGYKTEKGNRQFNYSLSVSD